MIHYADSALLVKLYVLEPNSAEVSRLIRGCTGPVAFTRIHELEVRTALRARRFRREITPVQFAEAVAQLEDDLSGHRWWIPEVALEQIFLRAEALTAAHVEVTGCRTLDLLHVAGALELEAGEFLSLDRRQREVALSAGLNVRP